MRNAERVRFELTVPFGYDSFQDCCLKPLGHLSSYREQLSIERIYFQPVEGDQMARRKFVMAFATAKPKFVSIRLKDDGVLVATFFFCGKVISVC